MRQIINKDILIVSPPRLEIISWGEVRKKLYKVLLNFGLFPNALVKLRDALQKLGVLPSDRFYRKADTGQIVVETSTHAYLVTPPINTDFFGVAKIEIVK